MSHRRPWLWGSCAAVVATGVLFAGSSALTTDGDGGVSDGRSAPSPPSTPPPNVTASPSPSPSSEPSGSGFAEAPDDKEDGGAVGAFLASGPEGIQRIGELEKWLGGAQMRVGHTYLPGDLWSNIEGRPAFLRGWAQWHKADDDRLFVLNVPMLERNEEGVPDAEVRKLLRAGARGDFDEHFKTLGHRLVRMGVPDTVLVLGWEMNGTTYTHRCGPDPDAWKAYWKRIVSTMRDVRGQRFLFDFAPNRGTDDIPWTQCYPGDDVVDIIGMDSYDQPPGESFDDQVNQPYGLRHQVDFAAERGKPISYPEWGLFRNGDNPEYMRRMLDWMKRHPPLYQTISDYCPHGVWQCANNPESSAVFKNELSADLSAQPSADANARPTSPTAPGARQSCEPTQLSRWFERWAEDQRPCPRPAWMTGGS